MRRLQKISKVPWQERERQGGRGGRGGGAFLPIKILSNIDSKHVSQLLCKP